MTVTHINPTIIETIDLRSLAADLRGAAADDIYFDTSFEDDDTERAAWDERIARAQRAMHLAAQVLDTLAANHDVVAAIDTDDKAEQTELTPMQREWLDICVTPDQQEQARKTLTEGGYLFADVVPCFNGSFSTGSTQRVGSDIIVPLLYLTVSEAIEANRECREEYEVGIRDGYRDGDDRYEGEVMLVKWQGDTLSFYTCDEELIGECNVHRAMGTA